MFGIPLHSRGESAPAQGSQSSGRFQALDTIKKRLDGQGLGLLKGDTAGYCGCIRTHMSS
jgi:hypothetical protein